jgi:hypothetical protein
MVFSLRYELNSYIVYYFNQLWILGVNGTDILTTLKQTDNDPVSEAFRNLSSLQRPECFCSQFSFHVRRQMQTECEAHH